MATVFQQAYYFGPEQDAIDQMTAAGLLFDGVNLIRMGEFPDHQSWYFVTVGIYFYIVCISFLFVH